MYTVAVLVSVYDHTVAVLVSVYDQDLQTSSVSTHSAIMIMNRVARTLHIRCRYRIFGREITQYSVIYSVYIRLCQP
jgi:hypothetical protein